jgi:hypothetical protein
VTVVLICMRLAGSCGGANGLITMCCGVMQIVRVKSGVESHVRARESRRARHARPLGRLGL